ncbi:MAG: hypothetical protein EBV31_00405, partial [Verrucomicrobia bacterium]|nr:hypothetical protein [Verrucomicrobiota bacterium]
MRNASSRTGLTVSGWSANNSSGSNTLGAQGLNTNSNVFISKLNGAAFSASNLTNNLIGGWAVADGSTFATYSNVFGLVAMGNTYGGYSAPAFDGADVSGTTTSTQNISDGTTTRTMTTGAKAAYSWRFTPSSTQTVSFIAGTSLTLGVGIVTNGSSTTIAAADATNTITGSGSELYLYVNQNTLAIQPAITGSLALITNGSNTVSLRPTYANNTYSGGTFANAGTLNLQGAAGRVFTAPTVAQGVFGGATIPATSAVVTMTSTTGLAPGMVLTNANFPAGTTVVSVDSATQVTLSTASTNGTDATAQSLVAPSSAVVTLPTTAGLYAGMVLTNANYPAGTTIVSVDSATQVTLSNASTATSAQAAQPLVSTLSFYAVPGDLTVDNSTVTMGTTPGQVAESANLTIKGSGSFTFGAYTTGPSSFLQSVTFQNDGGGGNPTFSLGTPTTTAAKVILTSATPITATNDSYSTTPTISAGSTTLALLQFSNANPVITVNQGLAEVGLNISATISQHASMATLTKAGAGILALSATESTFTTGVNLSAGGLMLGASSTGTPVTKGPLGTGTLTIGNGTSLLSDGTARSVANAVTVNGDFTFGGVVAGNNVTLAGAINLGAAGRTITVSSPAVTATLSGALTSMATGTALTKAGAGVLVLSSAANSLNSAGVSVTGGILKYGVAAAIPATSPIAISAGAGLDLAGFNLDLVAQSVSGGGFITNSASSTSTLLAVGTSASDVTSTADLSLGMALADNYLVSNSSKLSLVKGGLGTLTFTNTTSVNYGDVIVVAGKVTGAAANTFSPNATIVLGNASTASAATPTATLDVLSFDQTIGGIATGTNNAAASAVIRIGTGRTLTTTGTNTLGSNVAANDISKVNFTDGGAFVANGALFQVGGATGSTNSSTLTVDMTALASFTVNAGAAGIFRLGEQTGGTNGGAATMILSPANTITANLIGLGDNSAGTAVQTIKLGSGTNILNANTISIGSSPTNGSRGSGSMLFNGVTGTIKVRSQADTVNGRANFNLGYANNTTTASSITGNFDVTGHYADLRFDVMQLSARQGTAGGTATATFLFDTGSLDANDLLLGYKTTTGATSTATMTLGGTGSSTFNSATNPLRIGVNAGTTSTASGTLNVSGGTVTVAANAGIAIRLGDASAAGGAAAGTLNLTGGTLTVAGDIIRGTQTGTSTAVLNLDGGTLDMAGKNIGGNGAATSNLTTTTFASGTLKNVLQINNAGTLTKSTTGTLVLTGTNSYTGTTTVSAGVLNLQSNSALGTTAGGTSVTSGAALQLQGGITIGAEALTLNGTGISTDGAMRNISGANTWQGTVALGSASRINSDAGTLALTAGTGITGATFALTLGGAGNGSISGPIATTTGAVTKDGTGAWTLAGANTYSGDTSVTNGVLNLNGTWTSTGSFSIGSGTNAASASVAGSFVTANNKSINVGNTAGATGTSILNVLPGAVLTATYNTSAGDLQVGAVDGAVAVVNQSGGTVTAGGNFYLGKSATSTPSYGFYNITGGSLVATGAVGSTGRFRLGAANGSGIGLLYLSGGSASFSAGNNGFDVASSASAGANANAISVVYVSGSGAISASTQALNVARQSAGGTGTQSTIGQVTIGGAGSTTATASFADVSMGSTTSTQPGYAYVNLLAGGTLTAGSFAKNNFGAAYLAFNGGTLNVGATGKSLAALTSVVSYAGGATINTNGFDYAASAALAAPTGSGVTAIAIAAGGSNYVGAPAVVISGGSGSGATAIATVSGGQVTGIVITSPGSGYAPGDTLTVALSGGYSTTTSTPGTAATIGTITLAANTSGGLTKTGAGTLTLSGANTYTGVTLVSSGTLATSGNGRLQNNVSGYAISSGATLSIGGTETLDALTNNGTINLVGTLTTGANSFTLTGTTSGAGVLNKAGAGTLTLSSTGTFGHAGGTSVAGGSLTFAAANQLGGPLSISAGTIDLSTFNQSVGALQVAGGTVTGTTGKLTATSFGLQGGTISAILTGSGALTKTTGGTAILSGANDYSGATTISAGTLQLGNGGTTGSLAAGDVTNNATFAISRSDDLTFA